MVNRAGRKGTSAETAFVRYAALCGWPEAERRRLSGAQDRGDVAGMSRVCVEIKASKAAALGPWLKELAVERDNAGAATGFVVWKPPGLGAQRVGEWLAVMERGPLMDLMAMIAPEVRSAELLTDLGVFSSENPRYVWATARQAHEVALLLGHAARNPGHVEWPPIVEVERSGSKRHPEARAIVTQVQVMLYWLRRAGFSPASHPHQ